MWLVVEMWRYPKKEGAPLLSPGFVSGVEKGKSQF
jgi:hypothetical protein